MAYPLMFRLRQEQHSPRVGDVAAAVDSELSNLDLRGKVKRGETVAITCGCQRISNHAVILRAVVDHFRNLGAIPFIVPAMGIHGGSTAEEQRQVLQALGITEETTGAAVRLSTEAEIIGQSTDELSVYCDSQALHANHTVVVNRVSLHPIFHGDVQCGLLEMIAIGLGKIAGAQHCYEAAENSSFEDVALSVYQVMRKKANLLAGLMIVENGHHDTARVQAAVPEDFPAKEGSMLHYARGLSPRLPFRFIDILLVDEIGTTFSCLGADSNVMGRKHSPHVRSEGEFPQTRTVVYRDLSPQSLGNATGVGHAEFVRSRLLGKIDSKTTRMTSLAIRMPTLAARPIDYQSDREILDAALSGFNLPGRARVVWMRNTSSISEFECSEPYLDEVQHWKDLSVVSGLHPLDFDLQGNLRDYVIE